MDPGPQQLLDAIAASPGDDAARLVYADWLLESGNRLGELIVAQLDLAKQPDNPELERRAAQLISAHQSEVIGDLPLSKPVFRRGFVEAAHISALDFNRVGATLFERLPLLTELVIWLETRGKTTRLCASPLLGHLRVLALRYGRAFEADVLARNAKLTGLRTLELSGCEIGPSGCEALAKSPHLAGLRSFELGSDPVDAAGVQALSKAAFAPGLRRLRLWKTKLGPEGVEHLRGFTALETLELGFNGLDVRGVEALVHAAPSLRGLGLRGDRIGAGVVPALSPLTLTDLDLEGVRIGDAGVSALAKLDLAQLETLNLASNELTATGVKRLASLPLPKLRRLVLRRNELGRGVAKLLAGKLKRTRVELDEKVLVPTR